MSDRFIHITDLHFWEVVWDPFRLLGKRVVGNVNVVLKRRHQFVMERAWAYVEYVAGLDARDVIITGDIASTSTSAEFEMGVRFIRLLEEAGKRVHVIPGNHDVYTFASERRDDFGRYFGQWIPGDGLPCMERMEGGTPVVYMPTVCANALSSKGRITDEELARCVELVESCDGQVVVAGHYPILTQTEGYDAHGNRELRDADRVRAELGGTGRDILYVCGHVHRFSDVVDPEYGNIRHVTGGAFFRTAPESGCDGDLLVVDVGDDAVGIERHVHRGGEWVVDVTAKDTKSTKGGAGKLTTDEHGSTRMNTDRSIQ
jgi:3',5'-cyclic AMP phosphodiesterase CpdA